MYVDIGAYIAMSGNGKEKLKPRNLVVRISQEEGRMLDELKGSPHFINIPEYIRSSLRHLYKSKIKRESVEG